MSEIILKPNGEELGMRLDIFLLKRLKEKSIFLSRSMIQKIIRDGLVSSPSIRKLKSSYRIKENDVFNLILEEKIKSQEILPEEIPLKIIYEDESIAIIDKPEGLVVHPGAGNPKHTLVNALVFHFRNLSQLHPQRPGVVHRLDKETSGVMVIAKTDEAHYHLTKQFSEHSVKKEYIGIVKGYMEFDEDVLELPIGKDKYDRRKQKVDFNKNAKYAITKYKTIIRKREASLIKLMPSTGRTHQLRVHLSFIGHPILGDTKYGKDKTFPRLALHAYTLGFIHPKKNKYVEFKAPIPSEFLEYFGLKQLKI